MKKILWTLTVVILCFLTACKGMSTMEVREPNKYEGGTKHRVSKIYLNPMRSVKELADTSDVIIEAEFLSNLGPFDVGDDNIYTFYEMKVVQTIKGEIQKGETIKVRIHGGLYEDTLHYDDYSERFTKDFSYILFLSNPQSDELPYGLSSIAQGYLPFEKDVLSLHTNISGLSLFSQGQSKKSAIREIKSEMSSKEELEKKRAEEELQKAQKSLVWSEENGITIYEDGYTGELTKHPVRSVACETVTSFLRSVVVTEKRTTPPNEKIYHVGFYGHPDATNADGEIYMTISLTDSAVLCNGDWYTYTSDSTQKISDIFKGIA